MSKDHALHRRYLDGAAIRPVRQVTQQWLRHWFATNAMAKKIPDKMVMDQQGWRQCGELRWRQPHDTVLDLRPAEPSLLEPLW